VQDANLSWGNGNRDPDVLPVGEHRRGSSPVSRTTTTLSPVRWRTSFEPVDEQERHAGLSSSVTIFGVVDVPEEILIGLSAATSET